MLYLISSSISEQDIADIQAYLGITPLSCIVLPRADERLHALAQEFGVPVLLSENPLVDASKLAREAPVALLDAYKEKLSLVNDGESVALL